jgi:hypothetical protein
MEFNIFIAPITMLAVEMAKRAGLESKYLAFAGRRLWGAIRRSVRLYLQGRHLCQCIRGIAVWGICIRHVGRSYEDAEGGEIEWLKVQK